MGAELLVRGASGLAARAGITRLAIGVTVVAFGVSSAELAVSLLAAYNDQPEISVGNIVGSNTFNVLMVLGLAAAMTPLRVAHQLVRLDVPIMIGASVLLLVLAADGRISRYECLLLLALLLGYTGSSRIHRSHRDPPAAPSEPVSGTDRANASSQGTWRNDWSQLGGGVLVLGISSHLLVEGAVATAQAFGISELLTGLTIVATGNSLPELATALIPSHRGEGDIAVGSVIGGNIFHLLGVLGLSGLVTPDGIAVSLDMLRLDIPVMILASLSCLPIFLAGFSITRAEGLLLLVYYPAYVAYLFLAAWHHPALPIFLSGFIAGVMPVSWLIWVIVHGR